MKGYMKSSAKLFFLVSILIGIAGISHAASKNVKISEQKPTRLFLQQITSNSAIVKWQGGGQKACITKASETFDTQSLCTLGSDTEGNHKLVRFENLLADTEYRYAIDNYSAPGLLFHTAPRTGNLPKDGSVYAWILGDSGTATEQYSGLYTHPGEAQAVMDGFLKYNSKSAEPLDLILMLGDNAYTDGTDSQWQGAVFDLYTTLLTQVAVWPTIGNHEMGVAAIDVPNKGVSYFPGASTSANPNDYISRENHTPSRIPYLDIFTLPTRGESGGVASGSEQYYSFNYGNVHFVSLDSQLTARDERQRLTMKQWLIDDLGSNKLDWTVVIFHHPPYTRGSHDSDKEPASFLGIDQPIIDMREEFTPVFEDYGVDLVYGGHSHSYERSYYLKGHTGDADSFDANEHAELDSDGKPSLGNGSNKYQQISSNSQQDDKVVYTVAGSSGKVSLKRSGKPDGQLDHPAHIIQPLDSLQRHGLARLGSVVLNAQEKQMTARFINEKGEVMDTVVIQR